MLPDVLSQRRRYVWRSFLSVISTGLVSRLIASCRDFCEAFFLGSSSISDGYFILIRITSLIRTMFSESSIISTVVPRNRQIASHGVRGFFLNKYSYVVLMWGVISGTILYAWILIYGPKMEAKVEIPIATMLASSVLFSIVNGYFGSVLQFFGFFSQVQFYHIALSFLTIAGGAVAMIFYDNSELSSILCMSAAIPLSVIVVLCFNIAILYHYSTVRSFETTDDSPRPISVFESFKFLGEYILGSIGGCINKINSSIDSIVLYKMCDGHGVSYLSYSDHIFRIPFVVFGVGLSQVATSVYSDSKYGNKIRGDMIGWMVNCSMLFIVPSFALLLTDSDVLVSLCLKGGKFGNDEVFYVSRMLSAYSLSLVPASLSSILMPLYFAEGKSRTVLAISIISMVFNLVLDVTLVKTFGYIGVAYASSIVAWFNVAFVTHDMIKRKWILLDKLDVLGWAASFIIWIVASKTIHYLVLKLIKAHIIAERISILLYMSCCIAWCRTVVLSNKFTKYALL